MAKNDKILIDGIIDERIELRLPSNKRDEIFEYFSFEQILKDYDLSQDEIVSGSVDGALDGGIDGFFIFVNGHLLTDLDRFNWPKSGSVLEVWIITCKHHDTFKQSPLDNLAASLTELFDLSIDNSQLKGEYSETILDQRTNFKQAYRKVSPRLSEFKVRFCYASRGNYEEIGDSVWARANQIEQIANDYFGNCNSKFIFFGSTELIELHRKKPNFTIELPFLDDLSRGQTYILLVKLNDYFSFISDNGKLKRYLFDSNVRDFMGLNSVNEDIRNTLLNDNSPDFWWLNNGITILATDASIVGQSIQIQDIQIVNGLQTSESIFRYFSEGGLDVNNRSVLVKVIVSKNSENRDEIIRATNNQTKVELYSLHATDKIQRDVEEALKMKEFYYERRTNFYKNQGIQADKMVTPLYMASGFISLILKSPEQASNLKSKFMRNEISYNTVFSQSTDLQVWPQIAYIMKTTDKFLESKRPNSNTVSEKFLKFRRHYLSFITVSKLLGNFDFNLYDLIKLDLSRFTFEELERSWLVLKDLFPAQTSKPKLKRSIFLGLCKEIETSENIKGYDRIAHNSGFNNEPTLTPQFIDKVDALLPKDSWKKRVYYSIAYKLDCPVQSVFSAVHTLVKTGRRIRPIE